MKKEITLFFALIITTAGNIFAQNLNYKVYRAKDNAFYVASVIIEGEKDAVLIDAQFTLSDAHKITADILESGKNLTTIYISHGDPDYYFGLEVFKKAFPDVKIYTSKYTLEHIKGTYQKKLGFWGPKLGFNGPKEVIFPEVIFGNTITLEGKTIEVRGLNGPSPKRSYVWVPSLQAIFGGADVLDGLHLWMADADSEEERLAWLLNLQEMKKLNPKIVVPVHAFTNNNLNINAITYTEKYLIDYNKAEKKAKNSAELITLIKNIYPNVKLEFALELGAKVVKKEMTW